jgi:hypothetical protein
MIYHAIMPEGVERGFLFGMDAGKNRGGAMKPIHCIAGKYRNSRNLSSSEALYGFIGWLTSREEPVTLSCNDGATNIADLVAVFCACNGLSDPVIGWQKFLRFPEE